MVSPIPYKSAYDTLLDNQATQAQTGLMNAQKLAVLGQEARAQKDADYEEQQRQIESQAFSNLMSGGKGDGVSLSNTQPESSDNDNPGSILLKTGEQMLKMGAPKRGQDLISAGMDYLSKSADLQHKQADLQKTNIESHLKVADFMANRLASSRNQSEWDYNIQQMEKDPDIAGALGIENLEKLRQMPYSEDLRLFFRDQAMSAKDQLTLDHEAQRISMQNARDADDRLYKASLRNTNAANLRLREQELAAKKKEQGKNVPATASSELVQQSHEAIVAQIFNGTAPTEDEEKAYLDYAAGDIAGQALELERSTPGISYNEALSRVITQAQTNGDFSIIRKYRDFGLFQTKGTTSVKYKPRGRDQGDPIPLPADKSKLIKGRYYQQNGKVGRYGYDFN